MHLDFAQRINRLDAQVDRLLAAAVARAEQLPRTVPGAGIYLFSEGECVRVMRKTLDLGGSQTPLRGPIVDSGAF